MNKHIAIPTKGMRKTLPTLLSLFLFALMASCGDVNSLHQKYLDRGEGIYTGAVDSLKSYSGYKRVLFTWEINSDPRITKTIIFWNQRADSVVLPVNRTGGGVIPMEYELSNAPEGENLFEFITRDNDGHHSMTREIIALVYGDDHVGTLLNRGVSSIYKRQGAVTIAWAALASKEIQYVTVYYTVNGEEKSVRVENSETSTVISGIGTGDKIRVVTTYLPENGLDTMDAPPREYVLPEFEMYKGDFKVLKLEGDNDTFNATNTRDFTKVWDGQTANPGIYHSIENAPGFNFPHHFTFDMGATTTLSRFHFWPRTDAGRYSGHSPKTFEVWATDELKAETTDATYWKTDAWRSDWKMIGDYEIINDGLDATWKAGWEYKVPETVGRARYIRLVIKSNWQGSNCVNIGEITLWGD